MQSGSALRGSRSVSAARALDEVTMSEDETGSESGVRAGVDRSADSARNGSTLQNRRGLIKTGAILLPAILTLRATPAWAQTDYTKTAYLYGTNKGLCKNAHFNPNANPDSTAGTEFIPCKPPGNRSNSTPDPTVTSDPDRTVNFSR